MKGSSIQPASSPRSIRSDNFLQRKRLIWPSLRYIRLQVGCGLFRRRSTCSPTISRTPRPTGFKRSRVNFEDLMYLSERQPGTANAQGDVSPSGLFVGLGTKASNNTQLDLTQGSLSQSTNPLDLAIQGNGFFPVKLMNGFGDGIGYSRAGNFYLNQKNELILGLGEGYRLVPPVTIPDGLDQYSRSGKTARSRRRHRVSATLPGSSNCSSLSSSIRRACSCLGRHLFGH